MYVKECCKSVLCHLHVNNKLVMNSVNRACAELEVALYIYKVYFKPMLLSVVLYGHVCN